MTRRDTVRVRSATPRDADAMANLLGQLGYPSTGEAVIARLARLADETGNHVLVAELDDHVVGLATVYIRHLLTTDAPLARIASMVVDDAQRSRGVGNQLILAAEVIAREAGCDRVEVTSAERRTRAHAFYRRLGYEDRPHRFVKKL